MPKKLSLSKNEQAVVMSVPDAIEKERAEIRSFLDLCEQADAVDSDELPPLSKAMTHVMTK